MTFHQPYRAPPLRRKARLYRLVFKGPFGRRHHFPSSSHHRRFQIRTFFHGYVQRARDRIWLFWDDRKGGPSRCEGSFIAGGWHGWKP